MLHDHYEGWLFERFLAKRIPNAAMSDRARLNMLSDHAPGRQMLRHNLLVRLLCRDIDPSIMVRQAGDRRKLVDIIGLPHCLWQRCKPPLIAQRWRASESLGSSARRAADRDRFAYLSPFADGAFASLYTGWEQAEAQDRIVEERTREDERARILLKWPSGVSPRYDELQREALSRLEASWPSDPRLRLRSWQCW
jgi:hypothetical protein